MKKIILAVLSLIFVFGCSESMTDPRKYIEDYIVNDKDAAFSMHYRVYNNYPHRMQIAIYESNFMDKCNLLFGNKYRLKTELLHKDYATAIVFYAYTNNLDGVKYIMNERSVGEWE